MPDKFRHCNAAKDGSKPVNAEDRKSVGGCKCEIEAA